MGGIHKTEKNSVILYRQFADILRQDIREKRLQVGDRIETELKLSASNGISRGTVRQSLRLLEEEGVIERVPGRGTFLRKEIGDEKLENQYRIGVIIPFANDQLSMNILVGAERVAKRRGYQVVFNHSNNNLAQEKEDIARMRLKGVSGIIIFPVSNQTYDEHIGQLDQDRYPFVLVGCYIPGLNYYSVVADNFGGAYRAVEHLIILGQKEITFICNPGADLRTTSVNDRYLGYRKALADYNIEFKDDWLVTIEEDPDKYEETLQRNIQYLQRSGRPKAVFTVNDLTAIQLLDAAARLGVKIPDELAVVGFDDLIISKHIRYPLTTIHQPLTEMGAQAAQLLIEQIEGHLDTPEHVVIPTNLIIRESCGARHRILS